MPGWRTQHRVQSVVRWMHGYGRNHGVAKGQVRFSVFLSLNCFYM